MEPRLQVTFVPFVVQVPPLEAVADVTTVEPLDGLGTLSVTTTFWAVP